MDISNIPIGKAAPQDINVIIEIAQGAAPVKYEIEKASGALFVDRFLGTSMCYPANYGFVPHTLSGDGDPCDVLVVTPIPVLAGSVIRCRPIGALLMEDESGQDEKILAVPVEKLSLSYQNIHSYTDLPSILIQQIEHFFTHYKDLEKGKWVKIIQWVGKKEAENLINEAIMRVSKKV